MNQSQPKQSHSQTVAEQSYYNLCRFSDLAGFSFGYGGGARRASELIEANRSLLLFDQFGNITDAKDRVALVKSVTASVLMD